MHKLDKSEKDLPKEGNLFYSLISFEIFANIFAEP